MRAEGFSPSEGKARAGGVYVRGVGAFLAEKLTKLMNFKRRNIA